jgi:hypothetical protein
MGSSRVAKNIEGYLNSLPLNFVDSQIWLKSAYG